MIRVVTVFTIKVVGVFNWFTHPLKRVMAGWVRNVVGADSLAYVTDELIEGNIGVRVENIGKDGLLSVFYPLL